MEGNTKINTEKTDKEILKEYLGQYYRAKKKKRQLERRLQTFKEEMGNTPGMNISPVPHSQTNSISNGPAASEVFRIMEVEERIITQQEEIQKTMLNVMKIMDFLPLNSIERSILEDRHIDCMSWKQVCKEENMTRTPCNEHYNAGIEMLLGFKKVDSIIKAYRKTLEKLERQNKAG